MKITYDAEGDALYIYLREEKKEVEIAQTLRYSDFVFVDVNAQGEPLGVEVLSAQRLLGTDSVTEIDLEVLDPSEGLVVVYDRDPLQQS
jgi:uncharacterized protein YuzE